MDKGKNFLHNHPKMEANYSIDNEHVIVDRDAWMYIREELSKERDELTERNLTTEETECIDAVTALAIQYLKNRRLKQATDVLTSCGYMLSIIEKDSREKR